MVQDSIWHRKIAPFRQFLRDIVDSNITVSEALHGWREKSYLPKAFKTMTVQELLNNPKQIEELHSALRKMLPEKNFKFPYNRKERERELIELLAEDYNIMVDKAHSKVVSGNYNDGSIAFTFGLEAAMAPFNDRSDIKAGEVVFLGNINSGMHLDGGESFFSGGLFTWTDKKGKLMVARSVREILQECGFNTNLVVSKRRFHSILYLNLLTYVPDWSGGAGKTSIDLTPYAKTIANTVSSLAYKMPSWHGRGSTATVKYHGVKDESQIAQNYYLDFLRRRYLAVQANPSLKRTDRITQSGVWYRVHKTMVANKFEPKKDWGTTRETQTKKISEYCEYLSKYEWYRKVRREDLGIIASSRAVMYFDGHEYPVGKDNISVLANAKTTDIIVIEKEGMADPLKEYADKYQIALVFTRGRFVEYVQELIQEAISEKIDIKVWTLTDYDVDGMEIANSVDKTKVPRIGIDLNTVKWLQQNGYPNLKLSDVEEDHYAKDAETRTKDSYLWSKRIELDSIHSEVGGEGLWNYIIHQIKIQAKKGRDYTKVISRPEPSHLYPKEINELLDYFSNFFDGLIDDEYAKIKEGLTDIKNKVWEIENKKALIRKQLKKDIVNKNKNADVKTIIEAFQTLLKSGTLPQPKNGFVSDVTLKRQEEESDREELEEEAKDDDEEEDSGNNNSNNNDGNGDNCTTPSNDAEPQVYTTTINLDNDDGDHFDINKILDGMFEDKTFRDIFDDIFGDSKKQRR